MVSNESNEEMGDLATMHSQLDTISEDIGDVKESVCSMHKKEEIESLITGTIKKVIEEVEARIKSNIEAKMNEKKQKNARKS